MLLFVGRRVIQKVILARGDTSVDVGARGYGTYYLYFLLLCGTKHDAYPTASGDAYTGIFGLVLVYFC